MTVYTSDHCVMPYRTVDNKQRAVNPLLNYTNSESDYYFCLRRNVVQTFVLEFITLACNLPNEVGNTLQGN